MKFNRGFYVCTLMLVALASASDDDANDTTDEEADEGGTPIYDWSHHRWGSAETLTSSFLLVFIGLFGFSVVSSYYMGHVVRCTLFPEVALSVDACEAYDRYEASYREQHQMFSWKCLGQFRCLLALAM